MLLPSRIYELNTFLGNGWLKEEEIRFPKPYSIIDDGDDSRKNTWLRNLEIVLLEKYAQQDI